MQSETFKLSKTESYFCDKIFEDYKSMFKKTFEIELDKINSNPKSVSDVLNIEVDILCIIDEICDSYITCIRKTNFKEGYESFSSCVKELAQCAKIYNDRSSHFIRANLIERLSSYADELKQNIDQSLGKLRSIIEIGKEGTFAPISNKSPMEQEQYLKWENDRISSIKSIIEENDGILFTNCPLCSSELIIAAIDINCGVFRHCYAGYQQVEPHTSLIDMFKLSVKEKVEGCFAPIEIVMSGGKVGLEVCDSSK